MATRDDIARALTRVASGSVPAGWTPGGSPPQATKSNRGILNMINPPQYFDEAMLPRDQTVFRSPSARQAIEMLAPSAAPNGAGYGFGYTKPPAMQLVPNVQLADPSFVQKPTVAEILVRGGVKNQPSGGSGRGRPVLRGGGLVFSPTAPVGQAPGGDPWAGLRMGTQTMGGPQTPGLVTSNAVPSAQVAPPRPSLQQIMQAQQAMVAATDPRRGQQIMTNNNGKQVVGQRLNNSTKGRTVTGSDWFNSVTGL